MSLKSYLTQKLQDSSLFFAIWAGVAVFGSYFCMYMYRKPFTAAFFNDQEIFGSDYKILLIISQVTGYSISKFLGIKFVSSLTADQRTISYIILIVLSLLALFFFSLSSPIWGLFWLFVNGMCLGMIYGIVFLYLEGRSITELLAVILCANFIITSGISKTIGQFILSINVDEPNMPVTIGLIFIPLTLLFAWMLNLIPPPNERDRSEREPRVPMNAILRKITLNNYKIFILLFTCCYSLLTIIRDIRDNFGVEIWKDLNYTHNSGIYTTSEIPATLFILVLLSLLFKIKQNRKALKVNLWLSLSGFILLVLCTLIFKFGYINGLTWMIINGTGLFIPYILYNGILFDRFIGTFKITGNVGYFMYIVDAFGYLCSVLIMLYRNTLATELSWVNFYTNLCLSGGILGTIIIIITLYKINFRLIEKDKFIQTTEISKQKYAKL